MDEQRTAEKEKAIDVSKAMLRGSGIIEEGLERLKKQMIPGLPYDAIILVDDPERVDKLITTIAQMYVDEGLTIEELKAISEFQCSDIGKKLSKANAAIQIRSAEATQSWVYDIIEEVYNAEKREKEKNPANVIEVTEVGDIP